MDQFAWSKSEALYYVGILMSGGAFIACIAFCLISPLSKRYKESNVLIWGGFFTMVIGRLIFMPYRGEFPRLASEREYVMENGTLGLYADDDENILGCPVASQPWCGTTPVLGFPEFVIGYVLSSIGYKYRSIIIYFQILKNLFQISYRCYFNPNNFLQNFGLKTSGNLDGTVHSGRLC